MDSIQEVHRCYEEFQSNFHYSSKQYVNLSLSLSLSLVVARERFIVQPENYVGCNHSISVLFQIAGTLTNVIAGSSTIVKRKKNTI